VSIQTIDADFRNTTPVSQEARESRVFNAVANYEDFDSIKRRLLKPTHFTAIGGKDRINASGWGLLATALGMSVEIISLGSDGHPGIRREVLTDMKDKRLISFSAVLRVSWQGRVIEMSARCDSSETKHNQSEHKLEAVSYTRAFNRGVCKIVGGEPGDIADDAEDRVSEAQGSKRGAKEQPVQVSVPMLAEAWTSAGMPDGSLGKFLEKHHMLNSDKKLTQATSIAAYALLQGMLL
jgi:hypothetical protein